jgi:hypothetical protein
MAINHLFAFSATVDGCTIAAGSPYGCGNLTNTTVCYYGSITSQDLATMTAYIKRRVFNGEIDNPSHLATTPVVLFSGRNDWIVWENVMKSTEVQLLEYINKPNVTAVFNTSASHVWSLDHRATGRGAGVLGCHCGACWDYWPKSQGLCCDVNDCGYDLSGDTLRRFYGAGSIRARVASAPRLHWFDQWAYIPLPTGPYPVFDDYSLMRWGIIYLPTGCAANVSACRVHINYHGCTEDAYLWRRLWALSIDLNEYGEANDIIIVYPQAAGDSSSGTGCWNWDAYNDDALFDTRKGRQLKTVQAIIHDLENAVKNATVLNNTQVPPPDAPTPAAGTA